MGVLKGGGYHSAEAVNLVETNEYECEPRPISEAIHSAKLMLRPESHSRQRADRLCCGAAGGLTHVHETESGGATYKLAYKDLGDRGEHS